MDQKEPRLEEEERNREESRLMGEENMEESRLEEKNEEDEEDCEHGSSAESGPPHKQEEEQESSHSDDGEHIHKTIDSISINSDCDNDHDKVVDSVVLGDYVEDVVIKEEDVDAPDASLEGEAVVPDEPRRVSWTARAVVAGCLLGWAVFLTYCYLTLSPTCTPVTLHCPDPTITFTAQVRYSILEFANCDSDIHQC